MKSEIWFKLNFHPTFELPTFGSSIAVRKEKVP